ncbi:APSES transcription factor Xbp1 [Pyrenophora seminiperda CCB06]|uniref:APSES transcription factor Xbp1 n=1 Tax=Pyrenophora seminiperda CCB06 TaxID=1302712 RepID=A0A3M7MHB0_9PLEO|nr:APSES transcription factor Xbp1 [Pyrenophora seminiperda CCB06]
MKIPYLLNPFCGDRHNQRKSKSPTPASHPVATVTAPRRQKIPKDAPIFSDGNRTIGTVNFPPHENQSDQRLLVQHHKFQIYPLGEIFRKGVRHIPYNSEKKDFLDKTGRDAFESKFCLPYLGSDINSTIVFQYTYKRPGEDKEYVVVWDYNVGLVRMTPFFKSCKYSKTIPAKALRENPGLKEISYSITGGALVCQGYWMPYHAARAIAATFCYDIRWALTPVFGDDFPSTCLSPNNPCFAKFLIDPAIVQYCTQETARFRELGPLYRVREVHTSSQIEATKSRIDAPPLSVNVGTVVNQRVVRSADIESEYESEVEGRDRYLCSPEVSPRTRFTPINRPHSPYSLRTADSFMISSPASVHTPQGLLTPTSVPPQYQCGGFRTKRTHSKVNFNDHTIHEAATRPITAMTVDSAHGSEASGGVDYADMDAAETLLSLCGRDATMPPTKRTRHGSTLGR